MKTYKDRISELLAKNGMSNAELARQIQVSAPTITYWLGPRNKGLKYEDAVKISNVFGVSPDWLIYGEEKESFEPENLMTTKPFIFKRSIYSHPAELCPHTKIVKMTLMLLKD